MLRYTQLRWQWSCVAVQVMSICPFFKGAQEGMELIVTHTFKHREHVQLRSATPIYGLTSECCEKDIEQEHRTIAR